MIHENNLRVEAVYIMIKMRKMSMRNIYLQKLCKVR